MAQRQMFRGDSFVFDVQVLLPAPGAPPSAPLIPANITGWKAWFTCKYQVQDPDNQAVAQVIDGAGIVYTNPIQGMMEITVPPVATRSFPDGQVDLVYDVQVQDLAGNVFTVEFGTLSVLPDVTRAIAR